MPKVRVLGGHTLGADWVVRISLMNRLVLLKGDPPENSLAPLATQRAADSLRRGGGPLLDPAGTLISDFRPVNDTFLLLL